MESTPGTAGSSLRETPGEAGSYEIAADGCRGREAMGVSEAPADNVI